MFQTVLNPYDVFRRDIFEEKTKAEDCVFSTDPYIYLGYITYRGY